MNRRRCVALAMTLLALGCVATEPSPSVVVLGCDTAKKKICGETCADPSDVAFGCASAACDPCRVPHAALAVCLPDGRCGASRCDSRWGDCNLDPSDGCERDLLSVNDCGVCGTKCPVGQLCSSRGCTADCRVKNQCGGICIDPDVDELNCGGCGIVCPDDSRGAARCVGGACTVACDDGYGHCDGDPGGHCTPLVKYYVDADADGFGGGAGTTGCFAPAGTARLGGDCNDRNPDVFPGQPKYFGVGWANGKETSFDYDCSGTETAAPGFVPGRCGSVCSSGYLATSRGGAPSVNAACGSTDFAQCGGGCTTSKRTPFLCH